MVDIAPADITLLHILCSKVVQRPVKPDAYSRRECSLAVLLHLQGKIFLNKWVFIGFQISKVRRKKLKKTFDPHDWSTKNFSKF